MADGLAHKSLFTLECSPGRIFLSESVETAYSPNSTGVPLLMSGHTVVTMVAKVLFSAHIVDILTYQLRELESTMSIDKWPNVTEPDPYPDIISFQTRRPNYPNNC